MNAQAPITAPLPGFHFALARTLRVQRCQQAVLCSRAVRCGAFLCCPEQTSRRAAGLLYTPEGPRALFPLTGPILPQANRKAPHAVTAEASTQQVPHRQPQSPRTQRPLVRR